MSKEAIIDKIIGDAQAKADSFIADAKEKADEILSLSAEQCKTYLATSQTETYRMCEDVEARAKTVADLDARKLQLGAKSQILNRVFERALEKLKDLNGDRAKELLFAMLDKVAEDGDVVTVCESEKDLLTKDELSAFAKKKGITLTLADAYGNFDGGLILTGKGVDKNLTYNVEIDALRDEVETEIAKEIFG